MKTTIKSLLVAIDCLNLFMNQFISCSCRFLRCFKLKKHTLVHEHKI